MGREFNGYGELGKDAGEVRAMLEGDAIMLRGDIRARLPRSSLRDVHISEDFLTALTDDGRLRLRLGASEAQHWLTHIQHPPSLGQKLGVSKGTRIHLITAHAQVEDTLVSLGAIKAPLADAKLLFAVVEDQDDLEALEKCLPELPQNTPLWVLRSKGKTAKVKESVMMALMRAHGFGPSKTAAWSEQFAADRYGRSKRLT